MTWWAPFTFVAGNPPTAEEFNKVLKDNMLQTLAGQVYSGATSTDLGTWFSTSGVNQISGYQIRGTNSAPGSYGTRASSTYGTFTQQVAPYTNPSITVTTGTRALVILHSREMNLTTVGTGDSVDAGYASVAVSGATTIAASDTYAAKVSGVYPQTNVNAFTNQFCHSMFRWYTTLNAGSNTFTCQGRTSGASDVSIAEPTLIVIPFA